MNQRFSGACLPFVDGTEGDFVVGFSSVWSAAVAKRRRFLLGAPAGGPER